MSSMPAIFESLKFPSYQLLKTRTSSPRFVKYSRSLSSRVCAERLVHVTASRAVAAVNRANFVSDREGNCAIEIIKCYPNAVARGLPAWLERENEAVCDASVASGRRYLVAPNQSSREERSSQK